jgi:hypothetical protein
MSSAKCSLRRIISLEHKVHDRSSEEHNEASRSELRRLLKSFGNVKTLLVEDGLVEEVSRCLRSEDGEYSLELFPELQELTYVRSGAGGDAFMSFIDARENAGRPVALVPVSLWSYFQPPAVPSLLGDEGRTPSILGPASNT